MTNTPAPLSLLAMKGHPATGKSTLAQALARTLGWPLLDKDDIKDHTLALPDSNQLAYAILWQVVERQLALGVSVIVDSPLAYPVGYTTLCRLAELYAARLLVIETRLDEMQWRARLEARPAQESTHKIRGWQAMQTQLAHYQDCWRYPLRPEHHIQVDTAQPIAQLVALLRDQIVRT
ncbi:MAG: ATP-binding protein [Caldilineaceae bacterium]|nr:ATP-binding protein [Caldilineaceae bacterium]